VTNPYVEKVVIDTSLLDDLVGATILTDDFGTTLTLKLTTTQRDDLLRGDHPQLYLDKGAVEDVAGNDNLAFNDNVDDDGDPSTEDMDMADNDGDGRVNEVGDIPGGSRGAIIAYIGTLDLLPGKLSDDDYIDAANIYVTPAFFSGVETIYDGDQYDGVDQKYFDVLPLRLIFSEEISTDINVTRITITNEKGENPFTLTGSPTLDDDNVELDRVISITLSKSQRDKIALWQQPDSEIEELHVMLGDGAVTDIYGNPNEPMMQSKRIRWDRDDLGPVLTNSSTYTQSRKLLRLRFNEDIDLTPEPGEEIDTLVNSLLITLSPNNNVPGSVTLTNDELVPNQDDDWWVEYTLTDAKNDEISKWSSGNATRININLTVGAMKDIHGNNAFPSGFDTYISAANWIEDTVKPTFLSAYYTYSDDERTLVIRFSEAISRPTDLLGIEVHSGPSGVRKHLDDSGSHDAVGEALIIKDLSDDRHNTITSQNPQVSILAGNVEDLSGNGILATNNKPIRIDSGGPGLSATKGIYKHISIDDGILVNEGLLTLNFDEVIDNGAGKIDLAKIKVGAGSDITNFALDGQTILTQGNAQQIKIEITGDTVGKIAGLQKEYSTIYVTIEAGAVSDLAGNENATDTQDLQWTKDTRRPELNPDTSYYIHDKFEHREHYARLVLKFDELMETRATYIDFSGIVVANDAGTSFHLTAEELKPDQDLSEEIHFNLTDEHRDTISDWGKPKDPDPMLDPIPAAYKSSGAGQGDNELYIYLAEGSVSDRAGNSVVVKSVQKFAVAAEDILVADRTAPINRAAAEYKYDAALADDNDPATVAGEHYSTWEKDLKKAEYVSSKYDAKTKWMEITFDESMDQKPKDTTVQPELVTIRDKNEERDVTLTAGAADWTEQEKTTTVKFKVQPVDDVAIKDRANDIVGQSSSTIYMYLAEGVAVDYGGLPNAAIVDKKSITYMRDTQKPVLSVSDAGSEYYHKLDVPAGDDLGLLTLYFDEGVDKDYDAIDATKISLSGSSSGGGFTLTQAEIFAAPGFRVYPLGATDVNKIQFDLNTEHWNIIANEKWSKMYISIKAGAVKDTSGNAIAEVVSAVMHDSRYHPDIEIPVVELTPIVSTASAGQAIPIKAKVTDDIQVVKVRLYYQVGGAVPKFMDMTRTSGTDKDGIYEATIPADVVTNKGLCYYVWAEDQSGNDNINADGNLITKGADWWHTSIPGGFNVEVTDAVVTLPANTLPVFDSAAVPSTYRMISVPIIPSPAVTSIDLFSPFGAAAVDWLAWRFDGRAENSGYQAGHSDPVTFSKGVALWVGAVDADKEALTVTGKTPQISDHIDDDPDRGRYLLDIELHAGWNQIGIPFNFSRNWDRDTISNWANDNIKDEIYWFSGEKDSYSFASLDPNVPNQDVFATSWTGSGIPDNDLVWKGWPGSLDPWGGYWIYSNREGAVLQIDPTVPGKGVLPGTPTAPAAQMPYNWSVKVMPEADGVFGTAKFAGIVSDANDGIDKYDVMDLPALPGQVARLAFITEEGDYLQDMKAPADEMFWNFKVSSVTNIPVTLRFDASAVPSEYRTVLLIDNVTEAATDLRKASSYAYKSSEKIRNFKLIISKAHIETYIVPKHSVLLQNYPNPFNPETWVPYRLATAGDVNISIYNIAGQLVRTLELGHREAGSYTVKERAAYWDGRNATGERVASGVYFYNVQSGSFHATKRMVIVK
jgi:hypothetical protein